MTDDEINFEFIEALSKQDHVKTQEFLELGVDLARVALVTHLFPLHEACQKGDCRLVEILLAKNSHLTNQFDDLAETPLMVAVKNGFTPVVKCLIESGADVNANDSQRAGDSAIKIAVEKSNIEIIRLLLEHGADPLLRGWMQMSALDRAREAAKDASTPQADVVLALLLSRK